MKRATIFSLIDKAIFDYNLIEENDKILIGASGGKDSTVLIEYFCERKKRGENFSFLPLYVKTDFAPDFNPKLKETIESWGCKIESLNISVASAVKNGQKMNCWWCSTRRRSTLLEYAAENGFNKIALGHHGDDLLETLLMNMLEKAEISTMPPKLKYKKYPCIVIRPLCYCLEREIINHAQKQNYHCNTCTCTYQDNSGRKKAREKLELLTGGSSTEKMHMLNSMKKIYPEYLL